MNTLPVPAMPDDARLEMISRFQADPSPAAGPIPFREFRDEFLALYLPPMRARGTYVKMRQILGAVAELLGPSGSTADLTPALIGRFIASRPATQSANTTIGLLNSLRAACTYAAARGYVRVSPFVLRKNWLRAAPLSAERQRHHSAEAIASVLELMRQDAIRKVPGSWAQWRSRRLYALASTVAYCGLRRSEALRMRVEDVDIPGRMLVVVSRQGSRLKTVGSAQPIPMPDALAEVLADWIPHLAITRQAGEPIGPLPVANPTGKRDTGWLFPNCFQTGPWVGGSPGYRPIDRLKALGRRAGVEGFTFQSLRHSWATHAESRWGFSEPMIQRVLRHTNTRTQRHYRHADATNLKAAVKGLGFGSEPAAPSAEVPAAAPAPPFAFELSSPPPAAKPPRERRPNNGPKLDDEDVAEMRELRARGWSYTALVCRYKVSKSTLHSALYGITHKAVAPFDGGPKPRAEGV